jgi:hypothetical protein
MKLEKEDAKLIYDTAPKRIKDKLEKEFGADTFRKIDFRDLKTFNDLCLAARGISEVEFEAKIKDLPISDQMKRFARMEIQSEGINQGWIPDHSDTNQKKWFPIFEVSSSGLGFSLSHYHYVYASTYVGFCLCFETEEQSDYAGKQFIKLWEEFITGKNK